MDGRVDQETTESAIRRGTITAYAPAEKRLSIISANFANFEKRIAADPQLSRLLKLLKFLERTEKSFLRIFTHGTQMGSVENDARISNRNPFLKIRKIG